MIVTQQRTLFDLLDSPIGEKPLQAVEVQVTVPLLPAPQCQPAPPRGNFVLPKTDAVIYLSATVEQTRAGLQDADRAIEDVKEAFREGIGAQPEFLPTARAAFELIGAGDLFRQIHSVFALMEIAEEEIEAALRKNRDDVATMKRIWGSFLTCRPQFHDMSEIVYRAHVREIIARAARNEKQKVLNEGTNAEAMWAMVHTSFATTLNNLGTSVYAELFRRCFPEKVSEFRLEILDRYEPYDGAAAEEIARIKRKHSVEREPLNPRLPCAEKLCKILKVYRLPAHLAQAASL